MSQQIGHVVQGQIVQGQLVGANQVTSAAQMVMTTSNLTPMTQQHLVTQLVQGQSLTNSIQNSPNPLTGMQAINQQHNSQIKNTTLMQPVPAPASVSIPDGSSEMLTKERLKELVQEVDDKEQLEDDVEDMLMAIADDFIESTVTAACKLARHRNSRHLDVRDVQIYLERNCNMWIPGFGTEELKPYKRAPTTEAHKQRLALVKRTLKKY